MKNTKYFLSALAGVAIFGAAAGTVDAATTKTAPFTVTLTLTADCTITADNINFGSATTPIPSVLHANGALHVLCSNTTPYTLALDAGVGTGATTSARVMTNSTAGSTVNYSLFSDSAYTANWGNTVGTDTVAGTGTGAAQNITVYGQVSAGQISAPGNYLDTVTASVTF